MSEVDSGGVPDAVTGFKKWDSGKAPLSWLPKDFLHQTASVMAYGARKYDRGNWRRGCDWMRYTDAAMRHIVAWCDGEDNDPESGLNHLAHASCCLAFLITMQSECFGVDDRPKSSLED